MNSLECYETDRLLWQGTMLSCSWSLQRQCGPVWSRRTWSASWSTTWAPSRPWHHCRGPTQRWVPARLIQNLASGHSAWYWCSISGGTAQVNKESVKGVLAYQIFPLPSLSPLQFYAVFPKSFQLSRVFRNIFPSACMYVHAVLAYCMLHFKGTAYPVEMKLCKETGMSLHRVACS